MKRALLYSFAAITILYVVRELEYSGLKRNQGGEFAKLNTVFEEKNDYDLLVLGSSRAECQFYMPIIDSVTRLKTYNIGMTGAVMPLISATYEAYLEHSKAPEYVVLNLDLHSLNDNTDTVYKFPRYFAFLDNKKLYAGLQERDPRFFWFRWIPLYSMPFFTSRYLSNSLHGWTGKPTPYDADYELGFAPSVKDTSLGDLDTVNLIQLNTAIPDAIWTSFVGLTNLCRKNGSKLIVVVTPLFYRQENAVKNYSEVYNKFASHAKANNIPFIDMGHDSIRFNANMYADPAHLNKKGAQEFTRHFCKHLTQYIIQ